MLNTIVKKISKYVMILPRKLYYMYLRKKLKNTDFTIIANDCFGTFVYHNLNLKFNTPTINLFFSHDDFILFVKNLEGFLSADLEEDIEIARKYPVGKLTYNGDCIRIEFMHYSSFEEARNKWNERKKRVNFSNIFVIQTVHKNIDKNLIDSFQKLPYNNKLLITHENEYVCDCMVTHPVFSKKNYKAGEFLKYKNIFSYKRYMDDIDYVAFLNQM